MKDHDVEDLISAVPDPLKPHAAALVRDLDTWLDVFARHYRLKTPAQMDTLFKYHHKLMDCWHELLDAAPKDAEGHIDVGDPVTHGHLLALEAAARTGAVFIQRMRYDMGWTPRDGEAGEAVRQSLEAKQEAAIVKLNQQAAELAAKQGSSGHIAINVSPHCACAVASGLLLVLRHPGVQNLAVSGVCRTFVQSLVETLGKAGMSAGVELIAAQMEECDQVSDALGASAQQTPVKEAQDGI